MHNKLVKKNYRPEIDGLRAFAVVIVIINHFNKNILPGGYLGVDMFFVISGYVITLSLAGRESENFKEFLTGFFERRIKRLVPALIPFTIITGILICFFNPSPRTSLITGLTSLFGLSNFYLLRISTDYFASSTLLNAFTHTWSLDVEEQFYLVFPLLIWFTGFGRKTKNAVKNLLIATIFLCSLSLIGYLYLYQINQSAAYFLMPTRFWEMAAGCLVFLLIEKSSFSYFQPSGLNSFIVLFLLIGVLLLPVSASLYATILVVLLTSLLICWLKQGDKLLNFFTSKVILHIGKISYSLYLWHWTVLCISRWTIGIHIWSFPFQVLLMYLLSLGSYKFIELPFREKNWSYRKWRTIFKGILALIFSSSVLFALGKPLKDKFYLGLRDINISNDDVSEFIPSTRIKCNGLNLSKNCFVQGVENSKKLFLMGDSHAGHIIPLIGSIHNEIGLELIISTLGNYPYIIESNNQGLSKKSSISMQNDREKFFYSIFKKLNKGDIILFSSRLEDHLYEDFFNKDASDTRRKHFSDNGEYINNKQTLDLYIDKLEIIAKQATTKGINIVVMAPLPVFKGMQYTRESYTCQKEWFRPLIPDECKIDNFVEKKSVILNRVEPIQKELYLLSEENKNLFIYDIFDYLCPDDICSTSIFGIKMFRDDDHFSKEGALYLKENFIEFLQKNRLIL